MIATEIQQPNDQPASNQTFQGPSDELDLDQPLQFVEEGSVQLDMPAITEEDTFSAVSMRKGNGLLLSFGYNALASEITQSYREEDVVLSKSTHLDQAVRRFPYLVSHYQEEVLNSVVLHCDGKNKFWNMTEEEVRKNCMSTNLYNAWKAFMVLAGITDYESEKPKKVYEQMKGAITIPLEQRLIEAVAYFKDQNHTNYEGIKKILPEHLVKILEDLSKVEGFESIVK